MLHPLELRLVWLAFCLVASGLWYSVSESHAQVCHHCGDQTRCHKVCRLICEEKEIEVDCWGCKDEDFCVPCPSQTRCTRCVRVPCICQGNSNAKDVRSAPKKFVWTEWLPSHAKVFTKRVLMKRTTTQKVPSYKWVVEDLCQVCESKTTPLNVPAKTQLPPPPIVDAKLIYRRE